MNLLRFKRAVLKVFYIFRIHKCRVFLTAYEGKQYSCNPKYLFEAMCQDKYFGDYEFIWEFNDPNSLSDIDSCYAKRISHTVKHNSFKYFKYMLTSRIIITNSSVTGAIPLRSGQINLNTWHGGGAYKKVGFANTSTVDDEESLRISSDQTTYYVSSSRIFTQVQKDSVMIDEDKFISVGMPRNDIFFDRQRMSSLRNKVLSLYSIPADSFIVLYAPTYRGSVGKDDFSEISIDVECLQKLVKQKFSKNMVFLFRAHYFNSNNISGDNIIPVSDYPDMQELLAASDMLITDYSSSMWDFSLTGKPCILYVDDLDKYQDERGFYTPVSSWPGIVCRNTEELVTAVEEYDPTVYSKKINQYLLESGSFDSGHACQKILNILKK